MQAMAEREETRKLTGFVQIDDAYLRGELTCGMPGHGSQTKQPFRIAVETDQNLELPVFAAFEPVRGFDNDSLNDWVKMAIGAGRRSLHRRLACFHRIADVGHSHTVLETNGGRGGTEVNGAHRPCQPQACNQRDLPRHQTGQVRAPLPSRGAPSFQPPFSLARDGTAIGARDHALHALPERSLWLASNFLH